MSGLASGDLNKRVQLQSYTLTQDPGSGAPIKIWGTIAWVWADVNYQSVREFVAAGAEQSEVRGYMQIRYRPDVDAKMRIVHNGKWFAILGVMPDNESGKEHLTCAVTEGVRLDQ
jgi:SPP1 family predicted phage head-tail adaptor